MKHYYILSIVFIVFSSQLLSQNKKANLVYVDKSGVLRYTQNKKEAQFFGINYTVPFAYGYRSHKALGVDIEKAIDDDVYHFARLNFNAFRVHVWDTEITDSLGNLKENEHLRLFDYLVWKLKERNIKIFLTPLAFWGNGYPERDTKTGSFSSIWNKQEVLVTENAIKAQEEYLKQLLKHVNPYTKLTYEQDPDIIALEINNEPHHTGTKQQAADYINRMVKAVKNSGWTKPMYYNISESPNYAEPVANANIDGVSFQWYPTGLVANRTLKGNFLPNVDVYRIPFDTIPAYKNKSKMVYEFDAGDVYESFMYPAMARSFRTAGFQWATHFAYDPTATAYDNTEYQTHYVNLAYTPSKAISLLIAGKVFNKLPRLRSYGTYPADTLFDAFRVSYKNALSEMNTAEEFYYSNNTNTKPINILNLKHIAGIGNSSVVQYSGSGAYFLDELDNGVWRLEVMPDAILITDPFAKASPKKEVTRIEWNVQTITVNLPGMQTDFIVTPINDANEFETTVTGATFYIKPGTYIINKKGKTWNKNVSVGTIKLKEFVAPKSFKNSVELYHLPITEASANKTFTIKASVVGIDSNAKLSVEMRHSANKWKTIPMQKAASNFYEAIVPIDMTIPGLLNYRIIIQNGNEISVFPGNYKGDPYAWDAYINESYETFIAAEKSAIQLFNPMKDRGKIMLYNPDWRNNSFEYTAGEKSGELIMKAIMNKPSMAQILGFQLYVGDKLNGRSEELNDFDSLIIKLRSKEKVKISLIDNDAQAFSKVIFPNELLSETKIALSSLQKDSSLLLPRPYPGFHPLWFTSTATVPFNLNNVQKIEITFGYDTTINNEPKILEIEGIWLQKKR